MSPLQTMSSDYERPMVWSLRAHLLAVLGLLFTSSLAFAQASSTQIPPPDCQQTHPKYKGPLSDEKRSAVDDPYTWFITPEFAKRFCMPPSFIDPQLKGVLAIAAGRVSVPQFQGCKRISATQVTCNTPQHLMLDLYIDNRAVKLPKSDPNIVFFKAWPETSADAINFRSWRSDQRVKGVVTEVYGERRPFQPYAGNQFERSEEFENSVTFNLLGVRGSWASASGDLTEQFYRANWMPGIDLLRLSLADRYGGMPNPATREVRPNDSEKNFPIQSWAIGVIAEKDKPKTMSFDGNVWKAIPYPSGYIHTIELPMNLAQIIYEYDQKSGTAFFNSMQNRFEQITGSKAPIFTPPAITKP